MNLERRLKREVFLNLERIQRGSGSGSFVEGAHASMHCVETPYATLLSMHIGMPTDRCFGSTMHAGTRIIQAGPHIYACMGGSTSGAWRAWGGNQTSLAVIDLEVANCAFSKPVAIVSDLVFSCLEASVSIFPWNRDASFGSDACMQLSVSL